MTKRTRIILFTFAFTFIFAFMFLSNGCSLTVSKTTSSIPNKEESSISKTVKSGYEKAFNFSYETTTGIEGSEYFTKEFNEKNQITKKYQPLIINTRKEEKMINTMKIKKVKDIKINGNSATATALYKATSKSTSKKFNFDRTGEIRTDLVKLNNKWLINEMQIYTYK